MTRTSLDGLKGLSAMSGPVPEPEPGPVPRLKLGVARLLLALPPLKGNAEALKGDAEALKRVAEALERDAETVAEATLLRQRCLGDVMCLVLTAWEQATPEDRATPDLERRLLTKWREWVQALAVPTDAEWWMVHGRDGAGGVIGPAMALAAARAPTSA